MNASKPLIDRPVVLLDPHPRTAQEIFTDESLSELRSKFDVVERRDEEPTLFYKNNLAKAHFVVGQPPLSTEAIASAASLLAVVNVEGNFLQNMDYDACFARNIHVLSISPVFAQPVAEMALGLALSLARDIPGSNAAFKQGEEEYGLASNQNARLLKNCRMGFIGFGDLGRAILSTFSGLSPEVRIYDPWLSPEVLARESLRSCPLDEVLSRSDLVCVVASPTSDNHQFLGANEFNKMAAGTIFLLLSRADVVDMSAMMTACNSGHISAATDVFPEEPLPLDHPLRTTKNLVLSAHRAGALQSSLYEIGDRVIADLKLMSRQLPPQNCKRAEPELVGMMQSKPVSFS